MSSPTHLWTPLKKGDIVDIIAPASSCSKEELNQVLDFLKKWELVPRKPKYLFGRNLLCSQSDSLRFKHLGNALKAKDSKVIFCLRGGYGSQKLLPLLQSMKKPSFCKLLVGFSDITSLHFFLNHIWKWPSLHAPTLVSLIKKKPPSLGPSSTLDLKSLTSKSSKSTLTHSTDHQLNSFVNKKDIFNLKSILFGQRNSIEFKNLKAMNDKAKKTRNISAKLTGGNLSVLTSLLATSVMRNFHSQIVILEDVNEKAYKIDRMLTQWIQSGKFKNIKALIFGHFLINPLNSINSINTNKNEIQLIKKVIKEFTFKAPFPIYQTLPIGHGRRQSPLPLMTRAELKQDVKKPSSSKKENLKPSPSLSSPSASFVSLKVYSGFQFSKS